MNGKYTKTFKASGVAAAVATALGGSASTPADAAQYRFAFSGFFTMLSSDGGLIANTDSSACPANMQVSPGGSCVRTTMVGEIRYCDALPCTPGPAPDTALLPGTGTMTIVPFSFFGGGLASATSVTIQRIAGGNLVLGNMGFDWNMTVGIPVTTVWDAAGLVSCLGAPGSLALGAPCNNVGATPASNGISGGGFVLGPAPLAMTTWDTTFIPIAGGANGTTASDLGDNPSGSLPLIADTIGGSPMGAGPFAGANANFDFLTLTVVEKEGVALGGAPVPTSQVPAPGATNVAFDTNVVVVFDRPVDATTVAGGGFTLKDSSNNPIGGTVTPSSGSATQFTFNPTQDDNPDPSFDGLDFLKTYTATLASSIKNANSNDTLGSPVTWNFTVQQRPSAQICSGTTAAYTPVGGDSNFTMLTSSGTVENGTNDVSYSIDFSAGNQNTLETGTLGLGTNTLASPTAYYVDTWTAHHIRLFAPRVAPYKINTACTTTDIDGGTCAPNADDSKNITFTVDVDEVGAHILFDWNEASAPGNSNIDVVNVWSLNPAKYDVAPDGKKNDMYVGVTYGGPAGNQADPQGAWLHASLAVRNDGNNGHPMIDGPFQGFSANFTLGPQSTCTPVPPPVTTAPENQISKGFFGCSLTDGKVSPWQRADLGVLAGFLAALAFWRRRNRTNA